MRLPEEKIKEAVLHPERQVRQLAVEYFSDCFSRDPSVMPLAIRAIEQFGRQEAFRSPHVLADLAQTEATVDWAVRELHHAREKDEDVGGYFRALTDLLCRADPHRLVPREQEIVQAPGFSKESVPAFRERLELLSWDADRCWAELEEISKRGMQDESGENIDFRRVDHLIEALARQGHSQTDRVLTLLRHKVEDYERDPMAWMEIFLVQLAGEMRLEAAVPLIVAKMHTLGDYLSEESETALAKIGTDAAAAAVADRWQEAEWDYRLYASGALGRIHSDTSVRKCLELLPGEKDADVRTNLALALLSNYALDGVEVVRQLVLTRRYNASLADVQGDLVAACAVMGVTFPEYAVWKRMAEDREKQLERRIRELNAWRDAPPPPPPAREKPDDFLAPKLHPIQREQKKVGRNDPCPCGSGKKFKKCCMNKGSRWSRRPST
jgi:hypothetical protein